jgi:iron complex outermembrane receptor protein
MDRPTPHKQAACALVCALIEWSSVAHAQALAQAAETKTTYPPVEVTGQVPNFRQFGGLEITGSSIIRKEQTQALPVQIITRQDIQRQGLTSLEQTIERLPNAFNGVDVGAVARDFNGFTSGALHGMPTGTLVLLNGKRLAPFGIQSISGSERASVDLSLIPLSAVERIEVLTDGASSLYGTDAIAGVINIITRTEFNGLELSASHIRPSGGAAQGQVASLVWGRGQLAQDGYSLRMSAELDQTKAMRGSDRPNASQGRIGFAHDGRRYEATSSEITGFASPALLYSPNANPPMYSALFQNGTCTGNSVTYRGYAGGCTTNPLPGYDIYPASQNQKLHATGEVLLSNGATLYSELYFGHQKTQMAIAKWPSVSGRITNQVGAVGYDQTVAAGLDPSYAFYYWQPDLPALPERMDKTQSRISVGLKGALEGWQYHTNLYHSQARAQHDYDFPDLNASLGLQTSQRLANPYLMLPLDANNPLTAQLDALRNNWHPYVMGKTSLTALELRASRPWFEMNGKDSLVAWGLEARQETVSSTPLSPTVSAQDFRGKRHNLAAYTELQLPLRHDWDLIAAMRTERYSDVGATTNGKLASRWEINSEWAVRGSAGTGFRAPSVAQTATQASPYIDQSLSSFTCTDELNTVARALAASTRQDVVCRSNDVFRLFANGNPNLRPEKSVQTTLGVAFAPHRNLTMTADYWRVQMRDTLQFMSYTSVLADPFKYQAQFIVDPALIRNPPTNTYYHRMGMLLQMQNLGQSLKEGIDIDARWRQPGDWGRWHMGYKATYVLQSKEKATPDALWTSDLAAYSVANNTVVPRWRNQWTLGLEQAHAYWQMTMNHSSGYTDKTITAYNTETQKSEKLAGLKVPGFLTLDVMGSYQLNPSMQIRVGVNNLFNRQPPLSFYSVSGFVWGVNSQAGSLLGRTAHVGMTVKF